MKSIRVLSLFSGCGGMDLGFEGDFTVLKRSLSPKILDYAESIDDLWVRLPRTRFETVFANDILREARTSYVPFFEKRNGKRIFHTESIVDLVKKAEGGEFKFPEADVVTGGFPCQDFSVAGKRLGLSSHKSHEDKLVEDPTEENRGRLYTWMKRVVELVKPKVFIAENVKGLVSLGSVKEIIEQDFRNVGPGYLVVDAEVLHAGQYGIPQTRERVIFIGVRKDCLSSNTIEKIKKAEINLYPKPTHFLPGDEKKGKLQYVTLKEAFVDLVEPELSHDPAQQAYSKARFYGKHVQGQTEVKLDSLGPTIRAEHHGNIEFRRLAKEHGGQYLLELEKGMKERRLTVRECARIQTFPDEYEFIRSPKEMGREYSLSASGSYRVIGNAVPPLLAFHLAWHLQSLWETLFEETNDSNL